MKIYPDLTKLWGQKIREAGMTKNQAKKVFHESDQNSKNIQRFLETRDNKSAGNRISDLLKKLNVL